MEEIIAPISKEILKAELSEDKRLRFTNKSHNEIYVITYQDSPNVMKEIGPAAAAAPPGSWNAVPQSGRRAGSRSANCPAAGSGR